MPRDADCASCAANSSDANAGWGENALTAACGLNASIPADAQPDRKFGSWVDGDADAVVGLGEPAIV